MADLAPLQRKALKELIKKELEARRKREEISQTEVAA
jgi:hypothetical protein